MSEIWNHVSWLPLHTEIQMVRCALFTVFMGPQNDACYLWLSTQQMDVCHLLWSVRPLTTFPMFVHIIEINIDPVQWWEKLITKAACLIFHPPWQSHREDRLDGLAFYMSCLLHVPFGLLHVPFGFLHVLPSTCPVWPSTCPVWPSTCPVWPSTCPFWPSTCPATWYSLLHVPLYCHWLLPV